MRRRSNKSAKVPNVKLRPPQQGALSRTESEVSTWWAQDSQVASDDTTITDTCPRPFRGVILCATGVVDKPTLFKQAIELGATPVSAFTDRVTHLVALDHGGAKYICALERKIPILRPSWITESYDVWLRGDDVNLDKSVTSHRLPIFSDVVLCPSGITDIRRRTQINKMVTANGGAYLKNLERPVKVTHLLCSGDEETDKIRYAQKFNDRGEAQIHLVWEEWFWDSLDFRGRFDEAKYRVDHPRPERKSKPEEPAAGPSPQSMTLESDIPNSPHPPGPPKPPTRDADDFDEEPANVNVVPALTLKLWGGLLERRGYEVADGEIVRSPSKPQGEKKTGNHPFQASPVRAPVEPGRSVISSFRRANSFAPVQKDGAGVGGRLLPFRRVSTMAVMGELQKNGESSKTGAASAPTNISVGQVPAVAVPRLTTPPPPLIFENMRFRTLGEAKCAAVRDAIHDRGGKMVAEDDDDENVDFVVVRLLSGSKLYKEEPDEVLKGKYRTECWLEHCIFDDRVCPPEEHPWFVPLGIKMPLRGADRMSISISGFNESEKCGITRLMRALGIAVLSVFSRKTTHLICPSGKGAKFDRAGEWNVPVVNLEWLTSIAKSGVLPAVDEYLVKASSSMDMQAVVDVKGKGKAVGNGKGKGKAKAMENEGEDVVDVEGRINDITNNSKTPPEIPDQGNDPPAKKGPLDREAATIIPQQESSGVLSFGQPNESLGSFQEHSSSLFTPPQSGPVVQYGTRQSSMTLPLHGSVAQLSAQASIASSALSRRPTVLEIEAERKQAHIASSRSPSPMKLPRRTSSRQSLSPVKIDTEATKALQESITSILGKRQNSADDAGESINAKRVGKRAKSYRSKTQSRQPSDANISERSNAPVLPAESPSIQQFSYDEMSAAEGSALDQSMRVMYEDPGQREEKRRLMNLLNNQPDELPVAAKSVASGRTRRSTRIAGF